MKDRITIVIKGGMVQDIHTDRHDEYEFLVVDLDADQADVLDIDPETDEVMFAAENHDHSAGPNMTMTDDVRQALKRYNEDEED